MPSVVTEGIPVQAVGRALVPEPELALVRQRLPCCAAAAPEETADSRVASHSSCRSLLLLKPTAAESFNLFNEVQWLLINGNGLKMNRLPAD